MKRTVAAFLGAALSLTILAGKGEGDAVVLPWKQGISTKPLSHPDATIEDLDRAVPFEFPVYRPFPG